MKTILKIVIFILILIAITAAVIISQNFNTAPQPASKSFFYQFVIVGGPIVWLILLPLSIITVYLAIELSITIRRSRLVPHGIGQKLLSQMRNSSDLQWMVKINFHSDLVSMSVQSILSKKSINRTELDFILAETIHARSLHIFRKIEWANIIGNVAPMIGLFGTVYGMIKAFNGIVIAGGQPQPAQLAEGISLALLTTFWGLLVAIPAIAIYGVFTNRLESLTSQAISEAETIAPQLKNILKSERTVVRQRLSEANNPAVRNNDIK